MTIDEFLSKLNQLVDRVNDSNDAVDAIKNSLIYYKAKDQSIKLSRLRSLLIMLNSGVEDVEMKLLIDNKPPEYLPESIERNGRIAVHAYNGVHNMLCIIYDGGIYPFIIRRK